MTRIVSKEYTSRDIEMLAEMRHTTPSLSPQPVRCEHCTKEGAVLGSTDEDDALDCKRMKELGLLSL